MAPILVIATWAVHRSTLTALQRFFVESPPNSVCRRAVVHVAGEEYAWLIDLALRRGLTPRQLAQATGSTWLVLGNDWPDTATGRRRRR